MPSDEELRIKDYQIHFPPLGEGAYGRVFRATYRGISDRALKIFRPGAVDLSTMARELEKLSLVAEHQGIVTLHDFDLLNEPPYYAMGLHADQNSNGEWETRTLERLCGHVDHREGWRLLRGIADALAYLHRNQIVHCDVKPSNILLTDEIPFRTKICDFGQSRGLAAEGFEPVGTPLYASPEQLRDPRGSSEGRGFRWDVYSFGVVAYKLLTGRLPRLQALATAEKKSFDLESTLSEATLEATLAETGNAIDGEQLATMTEAVEEIEWPSDTYVPSDRRDLIEQCLALDPSKRPADMREVLNRIQQLDQQKVVSRARRLNTVFATLLVIAIWASGFAFVQAKKAKEATEAAMAASTESEKSANAATDLMLLFVSELNKGDISGDGADRLYSIVAENSETFLENRSKDRQASSRILRFSAQTASLRGRQALDDGNLEEALKDYTSAYDIRSRLAADPTAPPDLVWLASRDLMQIGRIQESLGDNAKAAEAYEKALDLRVGEENLTPLLAQELSETYRALARIQFASTDVKASIATLEEVLALLEKASEKAGSVALPAFVLERIRILEQKGSTEYASASLDAAARSFLEIMRLANSLEEAPPSAADEARVAYTKAVNNLGRIQLDQEEPEAALVLFREEIKLRELATERRPYDPDERVSLAEAYALAARCLDIETNSSRSLAIYYLEQAIGMISRLPPETRNRSEVQARITVYNSRLSEALEREE